MMTNDRPRVFASARSLFSRDTIVASICGLVVALMVGASYAAVPLYNWFCRATGFNGTTQVANAAPSTAPLGRKIKIASMPTSRPACRGGSCRKTTKPRFASARS